MVLFLMAAEVEPVVHDINLSVKTSQLAIVSGQVRRAEGGGGVIVSVITDLAVLQSWQKAQGVEPGKS